MRTHDTWLSVSLILCACTVNVFTGAGRLLPRQLPSRPSIGLGLTNYPVQPPPTSVLPSSSTTAPTSTPFNGNSTYINYAHGAITYLQTKYNKGGVWSPAGWWNSANALTLLLDLRASDNSPFLTTITDGPNGVFSITLHKAPPNLSKGFLENNFLDDEGWWTLAAIKGYDVTGDATWLTAAITTFADIVTHGLTGSPCGGVLWEKPPAKNIPNAVIATALFVDAAAQLAARYPAQKDYYVNLALPQLAWLMQPALFKDNIIQGDGLSGSPCTSNGAILSYQQGVTIGALVSLSKVTGNASYLATADTIAGALIKPSGPTTDANGILFDGYKTWDGDTAQFKGIFMRNLVILHQTSPNPEIVAFLQKNADSIWAKDRSGDGKDQIGAVWAGPWNTGNDWATAVAAHISGTMAIVSAALVS